MSGKGDNDINITVPLPIINEMLYHKIFVKEPDPFVKEPDPIYDKELQGKAIIAGKTITLLRFKPKLKLKQPIEIITNANGRPKLKATAWFHFSPADDEDNQEHNKYPIGNPIDNLTVEADVDISIDPAKGKIQINPKYGVLDVKVNSGRGDENEEPFCQLSIPLQLEKLKVDLPLGLSGFSVSFQAPINKTFTNSGTEFSIPGKIENKNIVFKYPVDLEEQQK
jgi:hypothetical protein